MLHIQNLHVCCEDVKILDYLNLHIHPGELHIIMGPNGAGKSTFAKKGCCQEMIVYLSFLEK